VTAQRRLDDADYRRLLGFRTELRRFVAWSEARAADEGLTAMQHQLLLAVRGNPDERGATVGDVADALLVRHHSASELVDRAALAGLVKRSRDTVDHRVVRLHITRAGAAKLARLSQGHLEELDRLRAGIL
jgi:DNA-binding MarR family transcriptional regulator